MEPALGFFSIGTFGGAALPVVMKGRKVPDAVVRKPRPTVLQLRRAEEAHLRRGVEDSGVHCRLRHHGGTDH